MTLKRGVYKMTWTSHYKKIKNEILHVSFNCIHDLKWINIWIYAFIKLITEQNTTCERGQHCGGKEKELEQVFKKKIY